MERSTGPCEAPFSDALAPVHPTLNTVACTYVCDGCCGSAHATGPSGMTGWKARCCASPSATRPSVRPGRVACAVIWPCSLSADNLPDGATACAQASQWRTHRRSRSSTPFSANSRAGHKPVRARVHVVKRGGWGKGFGIASGSACASAVSRRCDGRWSQAVSVRLEPCAHKAHHRREARGPYQGHGHLHAAPVSACLQGASSLSSAVWKPLGAATPSAPPT